MPNQQLSLAIGREGQNARLAARLSGYRIDIKPQTVAEKQRDEGLGAFAPQGELTIEIEPETPPQPIAVAPAVAEEAPAAPLEETTTEPVAAPAAEEEPEPEPVQVATELQPRRLASRPDSLRGGCPAPRARCGATPPTATPTALRRDRRRPRRGPRTPITRTSSNRAVTPGAPRTLLVRRSPDRGAGFDRSVPSPDHRLSAPPAAAPVRRLSAQRREGRVGPGRTHAGRRGRPRRGGWPRRLCLSRRTLRRHAALGSTTARARAADQHRT